MTTARRKPLRPATSLVWGTALAAAAITHLTSFAAKANAPTPDPVITLWVEVGDPNAPIASLTFAMPINAEVAGRVAGWTLRGEPVYCRAELHSHDRDGLDEGDAVTAKIRCARDERWHHVLFDFEGVSTYRPKQRVTLGMLGAGQRSGKPGAQDPGIRVSVGWP